MLRHLPSLTLMSADPRLFLILSINTLLIGVGLLALAFYLTFRSPEDMRRSAWLRRFKSSDWAQYLAGGIFFISISAAGIIKSWGDLGSELSETDEGIARGLFIAGAVALLALFIIKAVGKFND